MNGANLVDACFVPPLLLAVRIEDTKLVRALTVWCVCVCVSLTLGANIGIVAGMLSFCVAPTCSLTLLRVCESEWGCSEIVLVFKLSLDAPTGYPAIDPSGLNASAGEVTLTCVISPQDAGIPACNIFTWTKEGGDCDYCNSNTKEFVFDLKEDGTTDGNYKCSCANQFQPPAESDWVTVRFVEKAPPPGGGGDGGSCRSTSFLPGLKKQRGRAGVPGNL